MRGIGMLVVGALGVLAMGGCTAPQVYSDPQLTKVEGLPLFPARPILLPSTVAPGERPMTEDATIAYVPDLSRPMYVRQLDGAGSGGFAVVCKNGILTKFTQNERGPKPVDVVEKLGGAAVTVIGIGEILRQTDVLKGK